MDIMKHLGAEELDVFLRSWWVGTLTELVAKNPAENYVAPYLLNVGNCLLISSPR